jgi:predicted O-methyltransferase YrrM
MKIRNKIFRGLDPYEGFDHEPKYVDMQGWGSDHPILPWAIKKIKPSLIVEVGSWKGRSAINMAKAIKQYKLDGEILCVDTWLGSPEHWLASGDKIRRFESLRLVNGRPNLYNTFMNNVIYNNVEDIITPLPVSSEAAYYVLKELNVSSQLVYIDAGHEYGSVKRDIEMYWQILDDGGVMILDDYIGWPGVTKAVNEFALNNNMCPIGERGKAVLTKRTDLGIRSSISLGPRPK